MRFWKLIFLVEPREEEHPDVCMKESVMISPVLKSMPLIVCGIKIRARQ